MRRKIDFTLKLIPLESGGWNFWLSTDDDHLKSGYYSPLSSYINPERAVRQAREHAGRIALSAGARIGRFRITEA